jgi:hypothetical protein
VDEAAIAQILGPRFAEVELFTYWSSQARVWQWLGQRSGIRTHFGVEARNRLPT